MHSFESLFGRAPLVTRDAPGRVNLIGEHTDYNDGFVLPVAIPQRTRVDIAPRADRVARVWSGQFAESAPVTWTLGSETRDGNWADYLKGMTRALAVAGDVSGFDACVTSDVPAGAGLSSSAALEIAFGRAVRDLFGLAADDLALAQAGRRAENDFVGAPVGIMDQMACAFADAHTALFLDTRSLSHRRVPIPEAAGLIVIDSGIRHDHATGAYSVRRAECAAAAGHLGVRTLRDLVPADLDRVRGLPPPLDRRARHVITENARVEAAVEAFAHGDLARAGSLFDASHASLRDDFDVSIEPIDILAATARAFDGVFGARITGGGFGGSIVVLARRAGLVELAAAIVQRYRERTGRAARIIVPPTSC